VVAVTMDLLTWLRKQLEEAECYLAGVLTRRVEGLVETLGIASLSKSQVSELATSLDAAVAAFRTRPLDAGPYPYVWLDALAVRCRDAHRIVNVRPPGGAAPVGSRTGFVVGAAARTPGRSVGRSLGAATRCGRSGLRPGRAGPGRWRPRPPPGAAPGPASRPR